MTFRSTLALPLLAGIMSIAACSQEGVNSASNGGPPSIALADHHWDLTNWSGRQLLPGKTVRLDFDPPEKRFSGDSGCNRIMGSYSINGNRIQFGAGPGKVASTMMACPDPAMQFERVYMDALADVQSYRVEGDTLVLSTAKGETLSYQAFFKPKADAPRKFIYVSSETKPCVGVGPMTCLQVRDTVSDPWQLFYGQIEGFTPQPGIAYRLRVIEQKVENPPADGSSVRVILDQIIEQTVVK